MTVKTEIATTHLTAFVTAAGRIIKELKEISFELKKEDENVTIVRFTPQYDDTCEILLQLYRNQLRKH